jgi:tetratricopeptide (TPR) repeat protein/transglutaminase-like putative cysteine protease
LKSTALLLVFTTALPAIAQAPAPPASVDFVQIDRLQYRDRVEADGRFERSQEVTVLLRDGAAVAAFGQVGMPYVDGYGDVTFDSVVIEKADGRRIEVKDAPVEDINPFGLTGYPVAADVRFKKITIPGLEPGDRLSYRAAVKQKPLAPGRIFGEMKFPGMTSDPLQVYELDLPRDPAIAVELDKGLGATWEEQTSPPDRLVRRLSVRSKRPDFGTEAPTEAELEALAQPDVVFSNFRSWSDVAEWWWGVARDRLVPDAAVRAEAARIAAGGKSDREKIEALHAFVATRVRYLSVSFGLGRMQPRPAGQVLSNKYGDCKDKLTLLAALATAVGLDVRPVLINSGRKNLRDGAPGPQQFDHMIGVVLLGPEPRDWLWLDPTNDLGLPGYLLPRLRDAAALLIEPSGKGRVVRTPELAPFPQRLEVDMKGALDANGPLRAHTRWSFRSDSELEMRFGFRLTPRDRHAEIVQKTLGYMWKEGKITNVTTSDPSDLSVPFRVEFDAELAPSDRSSENEWALWLPLPDFGLPTARKKAAGDEKAAEFAVNEYVARAEVTIPDGMSARAPLSLALERPFARLTSDYAVQGSTLTASRRLVMLKRSVTAAEAAAYESFRQAVDKDRRQDFWVQPGRGGAAGDISATALHKDGLAAMEKKDYPRAVAVLEKAVAADPKLKNGFEALGRALRSAGREEDAVKAFTRQIEVDPFHEYAYAERAYSLLALERGEEAEKDLVKQIEVAPFRSWSYEKLGEIRMREKRYEESARHYASAAAIESNAQNWASLGWAQALARKPGEAVAALERARGLDPADWVAVRIASGYSLVGEAKTAGEVAESVLPKIADRLTALTAAGYGTGDLYWTSRLFEVWQLIGAAALARGDTARAEKYLAAAWQGGFLPEAAWRLGELRQQQKRPAEAASLWAAAESIPSWWNRPADFAERRAALRATDPSGEFLMKLRTVPLRGVPSEDFAGEVLILQGSDGKIESARNLAKKGQAVFDRARPRLTAARVDLARPDERPVKVVRRGLFVCNRLSTCSVVFDLPGTEPLAGADH